jgi:hypothetical protein
MHVSAVAIILEHSIKLKEKKKKKKRENRKRRRRRRSYGTRKSLSQIAVREKIVLSCRIFSLISYIIETTEKDKTRDMKIEKRREETDREGESTIENFFFRRQVFSRRLQPYWLRYAHVYYISF